MPRPVSIQDEVILKAAREVFLQRGLHATTSEIAKRAGVSHGILFKRFKTKQALFRTAMKGAEETGQSLPVELDQRIGQGGVKATLIELGTLFLEKFLNFIPLLMMAWSNKEESARIRRSPCVDSPAQRARRAMRATAGVSAYLAAEARLERVRQADFEIVAQMFIGALWHYAFLQVTLGRKRPAEQRAYVARLVRCIWSGLAPERSPKGGKERARSPGPTRRRIND
jgi:AcrR family transcriptional regulator